jgi:hypothetical protein
VRTRASPAPCFSWPESRDSFAKPSAGAMRLASTYSSAATDVTAISFMLPCSLHFSQPRRRRGTARVICKRRSKRQACGHRFSESSAEAGAGGTKAYATPPSSSSLISILLTTRSEPLQLPLGCFVSGICPLTAFLSYLPICEVEPPQHRFSRVLPRWPTSPNQK